MISDAAEQGLSALAPDRSADPVLQRLPQQARLYCVGGAVRDHLLGEPDVDRDTLVVGCEPEDLLAAGFRPVGRDFPVFLHPTTHAEFALARTERKTGQGYRGFVFQASSTVSLEEDLARRDLTVNAMAVGEDGRLQDPYGGLSDLRAGLLRHVSPAFSEDPVRLIRLARFSARWPDFRVAPETLGLCKAMVEGQEVDSLVPERVWQEFIKGLQGRRPSAMLHLLSETGAWQRLIGPPPTEADGAAVDALARAGLPADRIAAWLLRAGAGSLTAVLPKTSLHWQAFFESQGLGRFVELAQSWRALQAAPGPSEGPTTAVAQASLDWLMRHDLPRRPDDLQGCLAFAQALRLEDPHLLGQYAERLESLLALPMGEVAQQAAARQQDVRQAVAQARLHQLESLLRP